MALQPKAPFVVAEGQLEGYEGEWKQANTKNFAYLTYNPVDVNGNQVPARSAKDSPRLLLVFCRVRLTLSLI